MPKLQLAPDWLLAITCSACVGSFPITTILSHAAGGLTLLPIFPAPSSFLLPPLLVCHSNSHPAIYLPRTIPSLIALLTLLPSFHDFSFSFPPFSLPPPFFIRPPLAGLIIPSLVICSALVYISLSWFHTADDNNSITIHLPCSQPHSLCCRSDRPHFCVGMWHHTLSLLLAFFSSIFLL